MNFHVGQKVKVVGSPRLGGRNPMVGGIGTILRVRNDNIALVHFDLDSGENDILRDVYPDIFTFTKCEFFIVELETYILDINLLD